MRVYAVELSFNNKAEAIILPVNPQSMEISETGNGSTYDVMGLGQVNVIKDRELTEYSFSSIFPAVEYSFVTGFNDLPKVVEGENSEDKVNLAEGQLLKPVEYVKAIERWMATKRPIRFIFVSDTYYINTPVSIESFQWKEVAGSGGDIEYSITLKKFVFYAARKIEKLKSVGKAAPNKAVPPRPTDKVQPKTYKMIAGDTLWKIAKTQLGDGARWKEIQKLNSIQDAEITKLPVGKVLKLP
ncbi:LysM peptidoglycan-binding domain-containing protein [Paenibacillus sp. IITD108]|uniref:LysM peptidoglycan-binding domain-containing protein n=1 Tax=Paenibacillus sp. IITD108 TaxID=3116649 RepID=UPI002F42F0AB